ncbi:MAG TPA: hypothetical protein VJQ83_09675 [Tepidiformaceae bacterium]|nr:hypothetical protein [Tepidiformaceae bacterium]
MIVEPVSDGVTVAVSVSGWPYDIVESGEAARVVAVDAAEICRMKSCSALDPTPFEARIVKMWVPTVASAGVPQM